MNHASDTAAAGNGGTLGPEQAYALLDQTTQVARRKFQPSPPWLLVTRAVMVLAALGAIWLTVRGQHPYRGRTARTSPSWWPSLSSTSPPRSLSAGTRPPG